MDVCRTHPACPTGGNGGVGAWGGGAGVGGTGIDADSGTGTGGTGGTTPPDVDVIDRAQIGSYETVTFDASETILSNIPEDNAAVSHSWDFGDGTTGRGKSTTPHAKTPFGASHFGWKTGLEPATSGITIRRSNQLSYIHHQVRKRCERAANIRLLPIVRKANMLRDLRRPADRHA